MSELGFGRKLRLLTAADFQTVFSHAEYKVSSRTFLVLAVENRLPFARLGLVVGKKNVRLAIHRNRVKRLVRESFRLQQQALAGLDIIVLARAGVGNQENTLIRASIDTLWSDLIRRRQRRENNKGRA